MTAPHDIAPAAAEAPVGDEVRYAFAAGALRTLQWHAGDERPVALLLHGLPGSADDWAYLAPLLPGHHVVAVDRPGYGGSARRPLPVGDQVLLYRELLKELGDRDVIFVGHSYGAIPAAILAAKLTGRGSGLVLVAPALRERPAARRALPGTAVVGRALRSRPMRHAASLTVLSRPARAVIARAAAPMSFAPDPVTTGHHVTFRDRTLHPRALRSSIEETLRLRDEERLADELLSEIAVPTIVIHGDGDRIISPRAGQRTAQAIPGAEYVAIPGGHMVIVSRAREVAAAMAAFGR